MKLAIRASVVALMLLMSVSFLLGQNNDNKRSDKDDRNTAPTVGTGGPIGGPTGLFTVYDGTTLRRGEYTLSAAYSNFDRDPGNVDITSVPLSFQVALTNHVEVFFGTEAWRGIKVNSPNNLSSFRLPNATITFNGVRTTGPAIVLAPAGPGTATLQGAIFRPAGAPNAAFPFTGASIGTLGFNAPFFSGPPFGFAAGTNAQLGPPRVGGAADLFPGVGSPYGSILPGVVFATTNLFAANGTTITGTAPSSFSVAPIYLPDAPFVNRTWGTSSFNTLETGFKWRFNSNKDAWGHGVVVAYRWYNDRGQDASEWNMMNRGSGPGSKWGDLGVTYFIDARATKWANVSFNAGYMWTSKVKANFNGTEYTVLDPGDQLQLAVGVDFPVSKKFQPILEFRHLRYVGGRTPNALENNPYDGIAGFRAYPARWFGFGLAYRYHFNQQDFDSFDGNSNSFSITRLCATFAVGCQPTVTTTSVSGPPLGIQTSTDPHGYIAQFWVGRRNLRAGPIENKPPSVDSVTLDKTTITLPCPPGQSSRSGACPDASRQISVRTVASDPENDVLTYNYTVSGGRVVGTGANVTWDLSGAQTGTYTITTGVDDGCGVCGKTDTKTITIRNCPDCELPRPTCSCPSVSVDGPSGLTEIGQSMTFTASASGGTQSGSLTYNWSVSAGTITSGQGTPSITVATTSDMAGRSVTATLSLGGTDPTCSCPTTFSSTSTIASPPVQRQPEMVEEFGKLPADEVKARLDNFYNRLNADPTARGYVIIYGTPAQIKAEKAKINSGIKFRKYDATRLTFVDGPPDPSGVKIRFYVVPAGATPPNP